VAAAPGRAGRAVIGSRVSGQLQAAPRAPTWRGGGGSRTITRAVGLQTVINARHQLPSAYLLLVRAPNSHLYAYNSLRNRSVPQAFKLHLFKKKNVIHADLALWIYQ